MGSFLVSGEVTGAGVSEQTRELVAGARSLAGAGGSVAVAFTGPANLEAPGIPGCDVFKIAHDSLGEQDFATFDAATDVLSALVEQLQPRFVLFGRSDADSVIGPRVAYRSGGTFSRDCVSAELSGDEARVVRPVYGGNANASYRLRGEGPHVLGFRPGAFDGSDAGGDGGSVSAFDAAPHIRASKSKLIRTVQVSSEGVRLEEAEVVVSGGRGLGGPEPFEMIGQLADLLGGAVGASRAACDAGWIDHSHQVGLTGKTVSPKLYLAFGISGASQHMAGCSSARNIVAVNTDPDASIFGEARFGVVGDWRKVLPALISAVQDIA